MLSVIIGVVWFLLDFGTKYMVRTGMQEFQEIKVIPGLFSIQFVYNPGAAFGMLAHKQWLFVLVTLAVIVGILYYAFKPQHRKGVVPWALGFLLGGAAGNMIDRMRWGKVVDFFMLYHKSYVFPNFNVADLGITIGVALLILHLLVQERNGEKKQREGA